MPIAQRHALALSTALIAACLGGCGNKPEAPKAAAAGPATPAVAAVTAAARVNGSEVPQQQLDYLFSRLTGIPADSAQKARKEILDRLVVQQLAIDQAIEKKLDRTADVTAALEAARREVLARAYLEQIKNAQPKPTADEIKAYYDSHPLLFSDRHVFQIQEIIVEPKAEAGAGLKELVKGQKSVDEIVAWLKSKNIQYRRAATVSAAEQIPLELLPKVTALKPNQSLVVQRPQGLALMQVVASKQVPVDLATATPKIQQYLANERGQKAIEDDVKRLRAAAKIDYLGEFAGASLGPVSAPAEAAKPEAQAAGIPIGSGPAK